MGDSYIEIEGIEKDVSQFQVVILNGKILIDLSTKSLPKTPVKKNRKETEKN